MPESPEDWTNEYAARRGFFDAYTIKLRGLLNELFDGSDVDVAPVVGRTKTTQSFADKLRRKGYSRPLDEMTDLVGLRVTTYYVDDIDQVGALIAEEFDVDYGLSELGGPDSPDRFGYEASHYIVQLAEPRASVTDWRPYQGVLFEIQVRSVLQDAWAAISHKLAYKAEEEVPRELRRQLFRLSALLEVADREFLQLRISTEEVRTARTHEVQQGDLGLALDAATLEAYYTLGAPQERWVEEALELGFNASEYENPFDPDDLSDHVRVYEACGLSQLSELTEILEQADRWGREVLSELFRACERRDYTPTAYPPDMVLILVIVACRAPDDVIHDMNYVDVLEEALIEVRDLGIPDAVGG